MSPAARRALLESVVVTAALAVWIVVVEWAGSVLPVVANLAGALVALGFLAAPLLMARLGRADGDPYGATPGRAIGSLGLGLLVSVVVLLPFALGYDVVAREVWGQRRFAGVGLPSPGLEFQGTPALAESPAQGASLAVWERRGGVIVRNEGSVALELRPECAGCPARRLLPGGSDQLIGPAAASFAVLGPEGSLAPEQISRGRYRVAADANPVQAPAGLGWLLLLLLDQLIVVALPEEALFRGWMLGRLRAAMPPSRRVFGVPFGAAHVLSAALFALVHLAATPAPHRLLVFLPGLLFAWLAERGRHLAAPVLHHALSNVTLQGLGRLYG